MSRRSFRMTFVSALAMGLIGIVAVPEAGASGLPTILQNRYTIVVSPATVAAGSSTTFSVTFKNTSVLGVLHTVDLTVPSPLVVTGATSPRGTASVSGNLVRLRNLVLLPGRSFTMTVSASAGCPAVGNWSAVAKGILGLPFTLVAAGSSLSTTVTGEVCVPTVEIVCPPSGDCVANVSDVTTRAEVTAPESVGADEIDATLIAGSLPGSIDCPGYTESSSTLDFTVTSFTTLTSFTTEQQFTEATITFDTGIPDVGRGAKQVCFQSVSGFDGRSGWVPANTPGLLADCDIHHDPGTNDDIDRDPPCVLRRIVNGSVISLTFIVPPGDPRGRG